MKNENINDKEFDKFLSYNKAIYEYEENVNSFSRAINKITEEGYLVYLDDYNAIKELLNYNNYKKLLNAKNKNIKNSYFNINKFNQIKLLEPIKIKSADYIKNIILTVGCVLITKELFELISNKKEKSIFFNADKNKITLSIKNNEKLEFNHTNFILNLETLDKNSPNYKEINDIYESIINYFTFENEIANNLIEDRDKYGLLLKKTWIDEWKKYSNYDNIKSKYFNELQKVNTKRLKPNNIIIKEIIDYIEENKFKYKYPSEAEIIEVKNDIDLKNILKREQLFLVGSDFKNCFPYLKNEVLRTKFRYCNGKMNLIFDKNLSLPFNSNDNILSFDKIFGEIVDDSKLDLRQLIKIFCFQHSFPDIETKEYNNINIKRNKIILINKNKIQKYKDNYNYKVLVENLKKIIKNKKEIINNKDVIDYEKLNDNIMDKIILELSTKYHYDIQKYNYFVSDNTSQNFEIKKLENNNYIEYIDSFELITQDIADYFLKQNIFDTKDMIEGEIILDNIQVALFFNYSLKNYYEIGYLNSNKDFIIKYIIKESNHRYKVDIINLLEKGIQQFFELKFRNKDPIWIDGYKSAGSFYYINPKEDNLIKEENINQEEEFVNNIINFIQNIHLFNLDIKENINQNAVKRKSFENIYFINKECLSQLKKLIYYKEITKIIEKSNKNNVKLNRNDSIINLIKSEQKECYYNMILKNKKEILEFLENNPYKNISYEEIKLSDNNCFCPTNFELLNKETYAYLLKILGIADNKNENELSFLINNKKLYLKIIKAGEHNLDKLIFGYILNIENEHEINYELKNILFYNSFINRNKDFTRILNGKEINESETEEIIYGERNIEIGKSYAINNNIGNNIDNNIKINNYISNTNASSAQSQKRNNINQIYQKRNISKAYNSLNISKDLKELIIVILSQENTDNKFWEELNSTEDVYLINKRYYEQFNNDNIQNLYDKIWNIYDQLNKNYTLDDIISKLDNSIIEQLEKEIKQIKRKVDLKADSKNMKVNSKSIKIYEEFILINKNNSLFYDKSFKSNFNNTFNSFAKLNDYDIVIIKENPQYSILIGKYIDKKYQFNINYVFDYLDEKILSKEVEYILSIKSITRYIKESIILDKNNDYISPIFDDKDIIGTCYKYNGLKIDYSSNIDYFNMLNNEKLISSIVLYYNYQIVNEYFGNINDIKEDIFYFISLDSMNQIKKECNYEKISEFIKNSNMDINIFYFNFRFECYSCKLY